MIGILEADHAPMMDAIDAAMLKIKADGRMDELQKKWFGASFDTPDAVKEPAF
ncbi:amino acid ABC transporter, partial [Rhizobium leguminosarum]